MIALKAISIDQNTYKRINGVIGLEGIYDIKLMCDTWPTYAEWFVNDAFTTDVSVWNQGSPRFYNPKKSNSEEKIPQYLLLHSCNDELLDVGQTTDYKTHLEGITNVKLDTQSLKGSHDGVLKEELFYRLAKQFILSIEIQSSQDSSF